MLPFQVGAIDPNRPGAANGISRRLAVRVNRDYLDLFVFCGLSILLMSLVAGPAAAAKPKAKKEKFSSASPSATPGDQSLANIPLPIGHEAKGLVLPDFDLQGRLRGRFEAESAKRLDEVHIGFHALKITTYTPESQPDLTIELSESVLNLKTRILSSNERSTIKRADFNIVGDSVEFDTNSRVGKLVGNVKMVITSQSKLLNNQNE
jgi:lipopolysaccharide assembly outer membrane protein LptD (OstA)